MTDEGRGTAVPVAVRRSSGWSRGPARWPLVLIALGAATYAWLIYKHGSPFAAGSDSSGYLNSARLLAAGQVTVPVREIPGYPPPWPFYSHIPLGFILRGETNMAPTYPIGLPLHLAAFAPLVGWEKTARVVNAVNVLAAAALLYALGRRLGVRRGWALAAIAALWLSPLWIMFALQPMSDPVAVTWTLAAILGALRSRERWTWSLAAGAALGIAVLVRPANLILAPAIAIALGRNARAWLGCAAGGVPFAAALLGYNARAYGSAFTTGYGFVGDAFAWANVPHNLAHFALWLPALIGAPLAVAALALPWLRVAGPDTATHRLASWLLGGWAITFVGFYASYWFAGETWWYVRFLLPAFPAIIFAGLLVLQQLAARGGRARSLAIGLLAVGLISQPLLQRELLNYSIREGERRYFRACAWLNEHLPAGAIVASCQLSGAQYYYTAFPLLRWDQVPRDEMEKILPGLRAAQRPLYAALFKHEEESAMKEHLAGHWTKLHEIENDVSIWQLNVATH